MGVLSRSLFTHLIAGDLYRSVAIRSLDRRWHSQRLVRSVHPTRNGGRGISIALAIHSLDPTRLSPSLSTQLILQMYKVEISG